MVGLTIGVILLISAYSPALGGDMNVNADGNVTWADLPEGKEYKSSGEPYEGPSPLPTTWKALAGWLDVVYPADPPYDIINLILQGDINAVISDDPASIAKQFLGFAICFAIGFLFIIVFPIVALVFCCCRCCCNNCGGQMEQNHKDQTNNCRYYSLGFFLLFVTAVMGGGVACGYFVNQYTTDVLTTMDDSLVNGFGDVLTYFDNTMNEVDFIANDQANWLFDQVINDLEDVEQLVGVPVREELRPYVEPAIDNIFVLANTIVDTRDALTTVNDTQDDLQILHASFAEDLSQVQSDITSAYGSLGCSGCTPPDESGLVENANYDDISDGGLFPQDALDTAIIDLNEVVDQDLYSSAQEGRLEFENIPKTVANETNATVLTIISDINVYKEDIPGLINDLTGSFSGLNNSLGGYDSLLDGYSSLATEYDNYRSYAVLGLLSVILLVIVLNTLGLACGCATYSKDTNPTHRGTVSNCAGILLMAGVGVCFIFATFLAFLVVLPFIIGGPAQQLFCEPVLSKEFFENTIDKYDALPGQGYFLGNLLGNKEVNLTVSSFFESCGDNDPAYTALKLGEFFNLSQYSDYENQLPDIDSEFNELKIDLDDVEIINDQSRQTMVDFRESGADKIVWEPFEAELEKNLTDYGDDVSLLADEIRAWSDENLGTSTITVAENETLYSLASDLDVLQTTAQNVLSLRDQLKSELDIATTLTNSISSTVNTTLSDADMAQLFIHTNASTIIEDEVDNYESHIMGYLSQFSKYFELQLQTEMGRCAGLANAINSLLNLVCFSFINVFNGIWFTLGWCTFFMVPSIILGVKLAKYYRRMDYASAEAAESLKESYAGDIEKYDKNSFNDSHSGFEMGEFGKNDQNLSRNNKVHPE